MLVLCNFLRILMVSEFTGLLQLVQLYKQNPLEKCFMFTVYQNYTLALRQSFIFIKCQIIFNDSLESMKICINKYNEEYCVKQEYNNKSGVPPCYIQSLRSILMQNFAIHIMCMFVSWISILCQIQFSIHWYIHI